jgi:ribosome-associated protein
MTNDQPLTQDQAGGSAFSVPDSSAAFVLAERAGWHLLEKNAAEVVVLDLRGMSDVCDYFVLATGNSALQVNALAKHLHGELVNAGHKPQGLEGMNEGRWALLDFFDVVVHVFHTTTREYYQLDRLWSDAPRLDLDPDWFRAAATAARHPDLKLITSGDAAGVD